MAQPPLSGLSEAERARPSSGSNSFVPPWKRGSPWPAWPATGVSPFAPPDAGPASIAVTGSPGWPARGEATGASGSLSDTLRQAIEGLALKKPPLSAASIHRQAVTLAERLGEPPPSYAPSIA